MPGGPAPLPFIPYPSWLGKLLGELFKGPAWGSGGTGAPGSVTNPLTAAQADALFKELAAQPHIPFNWPRDGCFARAHEMRHIMADKGIDSTKYWNYASPGSELFLPTTEVGPIRWGWHVAPSVMVQGPSGPQPMVIDPSLFPGPVSPQDWAAKQGDSKSILQQSDGELYHRSQDGAWSAKDDAAYTQTQQDLEKYRLERAVWDSGIDPWTGAPVPKKP